jgi:UDP-2-acetamido-3-amino-2,3-dideoxy-glucuronate N-acetyltransferase
MLRRRFVIQPMVRLASELTPSSRFLTPADSRRPASALGISPSVDSLHLESLPLAAVERRIAVIGTGCWGRDLVRTFAELGALRAVCDSDPARLATMPNGTVKHHGYSEDCLADPDVSAVVIATPAVSHFELVRAALRADKDVFVEKPLALTFRDGQELVRTAAGMGRILMVGNVLRYHPAICRLKDMIDAGELGRVEYICSNRLSVAQPRAEENILWSFAPYEVSVILGLLGEQPLAASCQGGDYLSRGVSDVTISQFVFAGGVRAQIFVSRLRPFQEQRLVVVGSDQMAVFDEAAPDRLVTYPRGDWKNSPAGAGDTTGEPVAIDPTEPMKAECLAFLDSLETRRPPVTDGDEELRVLEVLDACERSLSGDGMRTEIRPPSRIRRMRKTATVGANNADKPAATGTNTAPL